MQGQRDADDQGRRELARRLLGEYGSVTRAAQASGLPLASLRAWLGRAPERLCPDCETSPRHRDAKRCRTCEAARRRRWSEAELLQARERWRAEHGRPPSSYDWNPSLGPRYEPGRWPPAATVRRRFGHWAEFLAAEVPGYPETRSR